MTNSKQQILDELIEELNTKLNEQVAHYLDEATKAQEAKYHFVVEYYKTKAETYKQVIELLNDHKA